jgi:hypothetical protein
MPSRKVKKFLNHYIASRLNKKESEISKWLSGNHNITIKTLAAIETKLSKIIKIQLLE